MSDNEVKAEEVEAPIKEEEKTASKIPDDAALRALLRSVLADSNLQELTKRAARRKLEAELGTPLPSTSSSYSSSSSSPFHAPPPLAGATQPGILPAAAWAFMQRGFATHEGHHPPS